MAAVAVVARAIFNFMASQAFFLRTRGSLLFAACSVAVRLQQRPKESTGRDIGICLWTVWVGNLYNIHKTLMVSIG